MKHLRQKLIAVISAGLLLLVVFFACKKKDYTTDKKSSTDVSEKFFKTSSQTDPVVAGIVASIKRQDNKRHFIFDLTSKAGYPIWDKSHVSQKDNKTIAFIPFCTDNQTKAILLVKITGVDTFYHLLYGSHYRRYSFTDTPNTTAWNAKDIFHAFLLFDHDIFNHKEFSVTDPRLVNDSEGSTVKTKVTLTDIHNSSMTGRETTVYPVTSWSTIVVCHECGYYVRGESSGECCNAEYYDVSVTYWFDDADDSWGWYPPDVGGGGGGGPANVQICNNDCNWNDTNPCELDSHGHAIGFCDEEWQPPTITEPVYNPLRYDSIQIEPSIHDSFPCLYNLIETQCEKINQKSQVILSSIFGVSQYNHLRFMMSGSNSYPDSEAIAKTGLPTRVWNGENMDFYDTIRIDRWFATHSSQETLIASIVHESVHAYIQWCLKCYSSGQGNNLPVVNGVDSFYLKEHFPFDWEFFKGRPYSQSTQHDLMVENYINEIVDAVMEGGNQSASPAKRMYVATALAYSGLKKTSVWNSLTSDQKCEYTGVQTWSEYYNQASNFSFNPPGCRSYPRTFRDSLQLLGPCQ